MLKNASTTALIFFGYYFRHQITWSNATSLGPVLPWCSRWRSNRAAEHGRRVWKAVRSSGGDSWFGLDWAFFSGKLYRRSNLDMWFHVISKTSFSNNRWNLNEFNRNFVDGDLIGNVDWSNQNDDLNWKWWFGLDYLICLTMFNLICLT